MIDRTCKSDPINNTHVTTIWNTTRLREIRLTRRLVVPRPPSRSTALVFVREDIHAGKSPETTAATNIASTVTASTGASTSNVIHEGGGLSRLCTVADNQS